MAGQPIYTAKAHVFKIDPDSKKKWLPLSSGQAVEVSVYFDSKRNMYRIISLHGQDPIINSTIVPKMNFSKTSQKFGQWADTRAGTVYGLGFSSEADLIEFSDKFTEVKALINSAIGVPASPLSGDHINGNGSGPELHQQSPVLPIKPKVESSISERHTDTSSHLAAENLDKLQKENERLRRELSESALNASRWEEELRALHKENADLRSVMEENRRNVEKWQKTLAVYQEEQINLSRKIAEMERSDESHALQRQLSEALDRLEVSQRTMKQKQDEVTDMKKKLDEQNLFEIQNQKLMAKLKVAEEEKTKMKGEVEQLKQQLAQLSSSSIGKEQLHEIQQLINSKINDLYVMNDKLADIIQGSM